MANKKLIDLICELQAFNNTRVLQTAGQLLWDNAESVSEKELVYIDTLKPRHINEQLQAAGVVFRLCFRPTEDQARAAWSGDGKCHGKVFAGHETWGYVFCFDPHTL
jgi:hypothetical protein